MLVAIISDIHDNVSNLLCSLCEAEELGCTHLLCTGDVAMLSTFRTLSEEWKHGIDIIFGNNEYDLSSFIRLAEQFPRVEHHGHAADISLNNRRVYLTHYPHIAGNAADSGLYDAVFYGHSHRSEQSLRGRTLLANPGEIAGVRYRPSFAVYNTSDNTLCHYNI